MLNFCPTRAGKSQGQFRDFADFGKRLRVGQNVKYAVNKAVISAWGFFFPLVEIKGREL